MAAGRSILFVSEKAAALDVVKNRLSHVGLAPFVLELHSSSTTRKQFADTLGAAIQQRIRLGTPFSTADVNELQKTRRELSGYADAVNEVRAPMGRTLHWAFGRLAQSYRLATYRLPWGEQWSSLTADHFAEMMNAAESISRVWQPVSDGSDFLWRDLEPDVSARDAEQLRQDAHRASQATVALAARCRAVDEDLGLTQPVNGPSARNRVALLTLLENRPAGAAAPHLTLADLNVLESRAAEVHDMVTRYLAATDHLLASVGPRWELLSPDEQGSLQQASIPNDLWQPTEATRTTQLRSAVDGAHRAAVALAPLVEDGRRLAATFGMDFDRMSIERLRDLTAVSRLAANASRPEAAWLNPVVTAAVKHSVDVLSQLVAVVKSWEQNVGRQFTRDALSTDLQGLHARLTQKHTGLRWFSGDARRDRALLKSIAVTGKANKAVVAALPDAMTWQQADQALTRAERDHAARLGAFYRRDETDFVTVSQAVEVASEALRLVGDDLNSDALARQLSSEGTPDPQLLAVAERLATNLGAWDALADSAWGESAARWAASQTPSDVGNAVAALQRDYDAVLAAAEHVCQVAGRDLTLLEARQALEASAVAASLGAEILDRFDDDRSKLGPSYQGIETDWASTTEALAWAKDVRMSVGGAVLPSVAERLWSPSIGSDEVAPLVAGWTRAADQLLHVFGDDRRFDLRDELESDLDLASELLSEMSGTALRDVPIWAEHHRWLTWFDEDGCSLLFEQLTEARVPHADVPAAVERAVLEAWVDALIDRDRRLRQLRAADRDAMVSRFQELDARLIAESNAKVIEACNARRPRSLTSRGAQLITRQANLKRRHWPIRQLLEEAGDVALEVKPCFMMSPLAVSQYLPSSMKFDVVIFDEASQVLPSDAVNCLYRGDQLIVAGDVKQLPPTNFFATGSAEEEDQEDEEQPDVFQSVLDQCKAAGALPSLPLSWHYRSAHESLIAFSNYRFYKGELYTFPSARQLGDDVGLESFVVDGVYRRGSSRDNPVEARKVVERILHHARQHAGLSLGVVTFSSAQEDAISAELERAAATEPLLETLLASHDRLDGFFVKSLESVQGDERDIILFSVGYGPDENGKITSNFGPLNREGGWRRLNVAITRARQRVEVVSSFVPSQITSENPGVSALLRYLDFAQRGMPALALDLTDSLGDAESPFEEDVIREIQALGYEAVPQVGTAGYRIDIGVRHPLEPGRYVLAVECDGAAYHSTKVARDRDRLREQVLTRLGWRVHRIWGPSWVRERGEQIIRLRDAIAAAAAATGVPEAVARPRAVAEVETVDFNAPPDWGRPYVMGGEKVWTPYEAGSAEARPEMRVYFERVLEVEAPVHLSVAFERLRADWDIGRVGRLIRENAERAIRSAHVRGQRVTIDETDFCRVAGESLSEPRYPTDPESTRKPGHVPPEEIELAVLLIIGDAVVAEEEQIAREAGRFFGWNATSEVRRLTSAALGQLEETGIIVRKGNGFRIR